MTTDEHQFYINTAVEIASSLGYPHSREDIERMATETGCRIHLKPLTNDHLHIGIYAVTEQTDGKFDVLVFACHEWSDTDFESSCYTNSREIVYNETDADETRDAFIDDIKFYRRNPIKAYYDLVDFDEVCLCHKSSGNRAVVYYKAWFRHVILDKITDFIKKK